MAKSIADNQPSTSENQGIKNKNNTLSLPKICLTRVDETLKMPSKSSTKTPVKRSSAENKKLSSSKNSPYETVVKRSRGRPKKENNDTSLTKNSKNTLNKVASKEKKPNLSKTLTKNTVKAQKSSTKLSKKALLQKKSKIAIPPAKKKKVSEQKTKQPLSAGKKQVTKPVATKQAPPKPKLKVLPTKPESSDSSEDEFLYDELIEELENNKHKQVGVKSVVSEKTTNIKLKPNVGNKPPIIVKGGIVKKTDLPADLKSIASPKTPQSNKDVEPSGKSNISQTNERKNKRTLESEKSPIPAKKSSPWPIAISSPQKRIGNTNKNVKVSNTKTDLSPTRTDDSLKINQKHSEASDFGTVNPVTVGSATPKIRPKQTAKVIPLSKTIEQDGNISDEYLEEERLECDLESPEHSIKANQVEKEDVKPIKSVNGSLNKDDPNIDLLRILTDDPDEPMPLENKLKEEVIENSDKAEDNTDKVAVSEEKSTSEEKPSQDAPTNEAKPPAEEEPPERTIYDLMNEVSLQYPSWNLHIIPETSAFCIAQITKGRLGLPTLKKCIELDPVYYSAKVYIHQYHIKRFDGVYDSEESILALIQEINNIKA